MKAVLFDGYEVTGGNLGVTADVIKADFEAFALFFESLSDGEHGELLFGCGVFFDFFAGDGGFVVVVATGGAGVVGEFVVVAVGAF